MNDSVQEEENQMPRRKAGMLKLCSSQAAVFLSSSGETFTGKPICKSCLRYRLLHADCLKNNRLAYLEERLDLILSGNM